MLGHRVAQVSRRVAGACGICSFLLLIAGGLIKPLWDILSLEGLGIVFIPATLFLWVFLASVVELRALGQTGWGLTEATTDR